MPKFGKQSRDNLNTCDVRLVSLLNKVVATFDCKVIEGARSMVEQQRLYHAGKSQLKFPDSKHNITPSSAVDVIPYPVDWNDRERFNYFAGYVLATAQSMGIKLRWGGDWDSDWQVRDNVFDDLSHFELVDD